MIGRGFRKKSTKGISRVLWIRNLLLIYENRDSGVFFYGFLDIVWSEFGGYDLYLLNSYYCWLKFYV